MSDSKILIFILFVGVIFWLTFSKFREREVQGRSWMLIRALFPSWRFFDELGQIPGLWVRMISEDGETEENEEWKLCHSPLSRNVTTLFLNGKGNLRLACNSLLEQLIHDISMIPEGEDPQVKNLVSYELATQLVRYRIRELKWTNLGSKFQFKVVSTPVGNETETGEDLLISAIHEVSHA